MSIKERITNIGCIVCWNNGYPNTPASFHHIHDKRKRRAGDDIGIPLCYQHHQSGTNNANCVSRHPWKREFEARYGTEQELYEQVLELLEFDRERIFG